MLQNIRPSAFFILSAGMLFIFSMLVSFATFANKVGDKNSLYSKTIVLSGSCQHLEIFGDIQIVLSPEFSDRIIVEGTTSDVNIVETKLKKGILYVRAQWVNNMATTKVIVPAAMLKFVQVHGNATISSEGSLNVPNLLVVVNGESQVKIKSFGKVNVEPGEGYYLTSGQTRTGSSSARVRTLTRADYFYMESGRVVAE